MRSKQIIVLDASNQWHTKHHKHYLIPNDNGLLDKVEEIKDNIQPGIALIVGSSHLFSLLLQLKGKISKLYLCDMDEWLITIYSTMLDVILKTEKAEDFITHLRKTSIPNVESYILQLEKEKTSLGKKHFLQQKNYKALREQLLNESNPIDIKFVKINLSKMASVKKLANLMKDEKITYANFTNIGDYFNINSLSPLPFNQQAHISYSIGYAPGKLFCALYQGNFTTWKSEYYIKRTLFLDNFNRRNNNRPENIALAGKILDGKLDFLTTRTYENIPPLRAFLEKPKHFALLKTVLDLGTQRTDNTGIQFQRHVNEEIKRLHEKITNKQARGLDRAAFDILKNYRQQHIKTWDISQIKQALIDECENHIRRLSNVYIGKRLASMKADVFNELIIELNASENPVESLRIVLEKNIKDENITYQDLLEKSRNPLTFFIPSRSKNIVQEYLSLFTKLETIEKAELTLTVNSEAINDSATTIPSHENGFDR